MKKFAKLRAACLNAEKMDIKGLDPVEVLVTGTGAGAVSTVYVWSFLALLVPLVSGCDGSMADKASQASGKERDEADEESDDESDAEESSGESETGDGLGGKEGTIEEDGKLSNSGRFLTPSYDGGLKGGFDADVNELTGGAVPQSSLFPTMPTMPFPQAGSLVLGPGKQTVKLVEIPRNECPDDIDNCDVLDSEKLGIGSSAMVADYEEIKSEIKDQGERNTCGAFVINEAVQILLTRQKIETNISEQNTYYLGKKATSTWNDSGIQPSRFIESLTRNRVVLVSEKFWPYNPLQGDCDAYNEKYPDATCTATEAQAGGKDRKDQDPAAAAAKGYIILESHQLFASTGRVKQALHQGYPVVLSVAANRDFNASTYKNGVAYWKFKDQNCEDSACGHAVLAIGYQDDDKVEGGGYVVIKNSWGKDWGKDGMALLTYEWLKNSIMDAQAIVAVSRSE